MKKVLLTGGGTAGHVTPNIALLPGLREAGFEIQYVGSYEGMERKLIENENIPYTGIATGKFRRYLSLKNLTDPFRVLKGYSEALKFIKNYKPDVVFSKGGFVSVPVVLAAKKCNVPVIIHESDMTPGLANRICIPSAARVCCNFPETMEHLPPQKAVLSGSPIRKELLEGNKEAALKFTGLTTDKPILMMMGGSTGSRIINETLRSILPDLLKDFQVIHLCGKGNIDPSLEQDGYRQYEYISKELKDLFAAADLVLSRAGANAICELLALKKPHILVPLSAAVSRGDQILNAESFRKQGFSYVLQEEEMDQTTLMDAIHKVYNHKSDYINAMSQSKLSNGVDIVLDLIKQLSNK
ncbi:MAG: undecaprenyldiphospho-muramoylpentapeptide beta-N-acetylglucosaminyltransferase [Clostridiales bacterium]|nr:undecaprenyldiphospho-muramoylpentapeptide beta-N-acetylglucosaminyltransferase [Clostridiales bacterium]